MDEFYIKGSDEHYFGSFWEGERKALLEEFSSLITREEANELHVEDMFFKEQTDDNPRLNRSYNFFAIPYELDDDVAFNGRVLIESIIDLVNSHMKSDVYCASTDRDKCCVVRCRRLSEEIIWSISSGHLNTPFIVFDKQKDFFLLYDYDLPVQIVGYKDGVMDEVEVDAWKEFFVEEWPNVLKKYASYTALPSLMKEYYDFIDTPQQ